MPVDNDLYNREARTWWEEESFLSNLRTSVNPVRLEYIDTILHTLGLKPEGLRALDVGCGGGYLTEELARLGFRVTGVDSAPESVAVAQAHGKQGGLELEYRIARAEALPFADGSFDLVTCCDVLEHVDDLGRVIVEAGRVLKPGGLFIYDTINRTFMTWLGVIFVAQELPLTRFFPPKTHDWHMFLRPNELTSTLLRQGIVNQDMRGMSSVVTPIRHFWLIVLLKYGRLRYRDYSFHTRLQLSNRTLMNYIGYGIKTETSA
jgi:2-polyprenyl-6-hydroxyphenyl methylase/3-demethylubiquinone-9 3-methyltransferase